MSVLESLKKRARFLAIGIVSFVAMLAVVRWSAGQPLVQLHADFGILIGFAIVAAFLVMNDLRESNGNQSS